MARMHSKRHGKAGSKRPMWTKTPEWILYSPEEVENLVVEQGRTGLTAAQVGLVLRDSYGIPSVRRMTGKSITRILGDHQLAREMPEDLLALIRKAMNVRRHLEGTRKDIHNRRALQLIESKVRRLVKYYRRTGKLAADFRYDPSKAPLYLR
ncbi:MAG: 30S ribosomal protein S15 [Candidatus Hodarchaeales archaeon]